MDEIPVDEDGNPIDLADEIPTLHDKVAKKNDEEDELEEDEYDEMIKKNLQR